MLFLSKTNLQVFITKKNFLVYKHKYNNDHLDIINCNEYLKEDYSSFFNRNRIEKDCLSFLAIAI